MRRKRKVKRSPESYVSKDPAKRAAQLSNLSTTGAPAPGREKRKRPANPNPHPHVAQDPDKRAKQLANLSAGRPEGVAPWRKHGATAAVTMDEREQKVQQVFGVLAETAPVRTQGGGLPAVDAPAVRELATLLVRLDRISAYVELHGLVDDSGRPHHVLEVETTYRNQAMMFMRELGFTPAARAKLGLDLQRLQSPAERLSSHLEDRYGDPAA